MVGKQPQITEATKEAFIRAFCELHTEHPGERISVRELTERAGYNRTTFYRYFQDTIAVLETMEDEVVAEVAQNIAGALAADPAQQDFSTVLTGLEKRRHDWLTVLFSPSNRMGFTNKLKAAVVPIYASAAGVDAEDPETLCLLDMFFSAVFSQLSRWFAGEIDLEPAQVVALNRSLMEDWLMPRLTENAAK